MVLFRDEPMPVEPPATVFADLSGFTRLTEEHGDSSACGSPPRWPGTLRLKPPRTAAASSSSSATA
jgi:hypothetical protein